MEDDRIDIMIDKGASARSIQIDSLLLRLSEHYASGLLTTRYCPFRHHMHLEIMKWTR
jgi:hypothetical protein